MSNICGYMPKVDIKNGFYNITNENDKTFLCRAIDDLIIATNYDCDTGTVGTIVSLAAITKTWIDAECAKTYDMARQARKILIEILKSKCIIILNYSKCIHIVARYLSDYEPLILNGEMSMSQRNSIIKSFNEDPNYRVLIVNSTVGVGISLHDMIGNAPRYMFISPSYKLMETCQNINRIYRSGTMSDVTVRIFYGNGEGLIESNIINAMTKKSEVLKGALDDVVRENIILPGDYETYYEQ